jgi:hypothetical protein
VIEWDPAARVAVLNIADPLESSETMPSIPVPSLNWTLPAGVKPIVEATVAVSVTVCPVEEGFGELESEVEVAAG